MSYIYVLIKLIFLEKLDVGWQHMFYYVFENCTKIITIALKSDKHHINHNSTP